MKHIKNSYFFVKDKVDQGNINIVHSPADAPFREDRVWVDVLTKPKSGRLSLDDRSVLMNCPVHHVDNDEFDEASDKNKPEDLIFTKVETPTSKLDEAHFASPQACVGRTP